MSADQDSVNVAALQEAANFYQSLPVDSVFVGMTEYLKKFFANKPFQVTPAVVKYSIKQIREHLGQQDLWEREVARIEDEMFHRCQEHSDVPICVSVEELAESITGDAVQYFKEECTMQFEIGMKVKRVVGLKNVIYDNRRYGIVRANDLAYIVDHNPFDEATMHGYKQCHPKQEDFESSEAYAAAVREYDQKEISRQAQILALAKMILVSWLDRDGNLLAEEWLRPDQLEEHTEKADEPAAVIA